MQPLLRRASSPSPMLLTGAAVVTCIRDPEGRMNEEATLSADELTRYHRQMILPGLGREGQLRIRAARVLVIGMGGLGSPAAMYLAAAGLGTLGLADFDKVELHNLHRQILHDTPRCGMAKLDSALRSLSAINPHCRLVPHSQGIRAEDLPGLFADYDVIVDCTDNFPTRYMVSDACVLARRPLAYGSIFQYEGQASFFDPAQDAPCYRCLFPEMPEPGSVPNCAQAGVIGALCGIIGSIQAMEALKFVSGVGENLLGRLLVVDAATMAFRTLNIKRDLNCPSCSHNARIRSIIAQEYDGAAHCQNLDMARRDEISAADLQGLIETGHSPLLLDVRDPDECRLGMLPGALNIPLYELAGRLDEMEQSMPVVTYCHSGLRSMRALKFMRERGFKSVLNLRGGILAWIREVDPTMKAF